MSNFHSSLGNILNLVLFYCPGVIYLQFLVALPLQYHLSYSFLTGWEDLLIGTTSTAESGQKTFKIVDSYK